MTEELFVPLEVHFIVPSFQNYPVIYMTGNDRSLGSNNLEQLRPMIYDGNAWHLYVKTKQPALYYRFISIKSNIIFPRIAYTRDNLTVIDEECPPEDPLSRCGVVGTIMMQDRQLQCECSLFPSKPYLLVAFVAFLPRNAEPVIMAQNTHPPWKTPIYMQYRGGRTFGVELDFDIGEFKLCLLYNDGYLEWEGQFNRKLPSACLPLQYNMMFAHTRRFLFEFEGVLAPKTRNFSVLDDFVRKLDHSDEFIIINPFYDTSAVGLDFEFGGVLPNVQTILEEIDDFFANDSCEGIIISLSVYDFLHRTGQISEFEADPHAYSSQHLQKRVFNLFWNRLRCVDDEAHFRIISFAWLQIYHLKQLIRLQSNLREAGKIIMLQMREEREMDRFLPLFDVSRPRYYANFASIALYDGELDIQDDFILCQRTGQEIHIGDQFVFRIRQ